MTYFDELRVFFIVALEPLRLLLMEAQDIAVLYRLKAFDFDSELGEFAILYWL
jgi:hypothetical protein